MYFKLSNTAEMKVMESEANALFKYPNLYAPKVVISGLTEVSIPVITMEEQNVITLAIWGLLPSNYSDDWELFQNLTNTLNIHTDTLDSGLWYTNSFKARRCIIPITGFYTSVLKNGEVDPYYIESKNESILYLAGMYNVLEDGFITCTILTGPLDEYLMKYQNLINFMPHILNGKYKQEWLSSDTDNTRLREILKMPHNTPLKAKPIAKGLFNLDISYDSMLMPSDFPDN